MKNEEVTRAFVPGEWWALLDPLGLMKVVEVDVESSEGILVARVWRTSESPALRLINRVPGKCRYLWFKLGLGEVKGHRTGEVRIAVQNERLFFMAVEGSDTFILADWEVSVNEHYNHSYVYQDAPEDCEFSNQSVG